MRKHIFALVFCCFASLLAAQPSAPQSKPAAASPENVKAALADLDSFIRSSMAATKVPGLSVAVVYNDEVLFLKGYGVRKAGESAAVDPDTVFELASVSKPITSTILASLVGAQKIGWDDRIVTLNPEFQLSSADVTQQVTIRDFLSHRSGLATESGDFLEDLMFSRPEILYRMRYLALPGQFRKSYAYSNFGYTTPAIATATKLGKPWETIAEEQLYTPLGMTSTSSRFSDYEDRSNKAALHVFINGEPLNRFVRDADAEAPAGGVSSSARDLVKWMQLQLNAGMWNGKQLIDSAALEETHKPEVCPAAPAAALKDCPGGSYYGMGWDVRTNELGHAQLGHSGAFFLGASTTVYLIPEEHIGVLVLTNAMPIGLPESIALHFLDTVHYGKAQRDYLPLIGKYMSDMIAKSQDASPNYLTLSPPTAATAAKPLSTYVGTYANEYYGNLEISVEGTKLILRLPPRGAYYELTHWDGDTFTYYFASENTGIGRRGAKFSPDKNQVLIESLTPEHNAVFTRVATPQN